jgi:hypothetical protein
MLESQWYSSNRFETKRLIETNGALVRAGDVVEHHGFEASLACSLQRVLDHEASDTPAHGRRRGHVTNVRYMSTRPGPVREKMVSADYPFSVFDNEGFIVRSLPIGEGSGFAHVGREWISLTGTYRRLHNAPYRVLIIGTGTSHKHGPQFRCLHH